ncbi:MAG: hypothetical protein RL329_1555 [Bacteroidota bacterium]|jgi:hypothetical protein
MIIVQDKLISDELIEEQFVCNLNACKGACCWEGDFGAPLEKDELAILKQIYPAVRPYLTESGQKVIDSEGTSQYFRGMKSYGTSLVEGGACAFMTMTAAGVSQCGIEQAWRDGKTTFRKPISCHLYPIRVSKSKSMGTEMLNYDRWDICTAACSLGKKEQVPVYQFLKEALIRAYGADFYEELDAAAQFMQSNKP